MDVLRLTRERRDPYEVRSLRTTFKGTTLEITRIDIEKSSDFIAFSTCSALTLKKIKKVEKREKAGMQQNHCKGDTFLK